VRQRWLLAGLLAALSLLTVSWFATRAYIIHPTVIAQPPEIGPTVQTAIRQKVRIRCPALADDGGGAYYVSEAGRELFFNEASWRLPSQTRLCEASRSDRRATLSAIVLLGVLAAGAVLAEGTIRDRRRAMVLPSLASDAEDVRSY